MNPPRTRLLLLAFAGLIFGVYLQTAAPGAWWGDGLELAAAAKTLGVPHPTGYPLYMIVGHGAIRALGWIDPGRALTLFSALLCAASVFLMGRLVFDRLAAASHAGSGARVLAISCGWMALIGLSRTLWEHATFAEVYPLTLALVTGIVTLAASREEPEGASWGRVAAIAVVWGLASLNHYSFLAAGPLVVLTLVAQGRTPRKTLLYCALFLVISVFFLLGYFYLPLRAAVNPPINWGDPVGPRGVLWVLSGGDYITMNTPGTGASSVAAMLAGLDRWMRWWGEQFLPMALTEGAGSAALMANRILGALIAAGALAGCALMSRKRRMFGWGLAASILMTALFAMLYRIPDLDAYFLPALPAAVLGWLELILAIQRDGPDADFKKPIPLALGAAPLMLGCILLAMNFRSIDKSWDDGPRIWAGHVLDALPEGALVITQQAYDSEIYALWYEQIVRGRRPDVTVFGAGFIFKGWYRRYFEAAGRPRADLFITDLAPGDKSVFDIALVGGVIMPNARKRRIFATYRDPVFDQHMAPSRPVELLSLDYYGRTAYRLNPPGRLLFELHPDPGFAPTARRKFIETFGREPPGGG